MVAAAGQIGDHVADEIGGELIHYRACLTENSADSIARPRDRATNDFARTRHPVGKGAHGDEITAAQNRIDGCDQLTSARVFGHLADEDLVPMLGDNRGCRGKPSDFGLVDDRILTLARQAGEIEIGEKVGDVYRPR